MVHINSYLTWTPSTSLSQQIYCDLTIQCLHDLRQSLSLQTLIHVLAGLYFLQPSGSSVANSDYRSTNRNPAADFPCTSCILLGNMSVESPVKCTDPLCRYSLQTSLSKRPYRLPSSIRLERCITIRTLQTATLPSQGVCCSTIQVIHTRLVQSPNQKRPQEGGLASTDVQQATIPFSSKFQRLSIFFSFHRII